MAVLLMRGFGTQQVNHHRKLFNDELAMSPPSGKIQAGPKPAESLG